MILVGNFLTFILLSSPLLGVLAGVCSSGPYLYDDSCQYTSQGIGSSMNRMKHMIVLSEAYMMRIIPNPRCFQSSEHNTDMTEYFGWGMALDCTAEDVKNAKEIKNITDGDTVGLFRMMVNVGDPVKINSRSPEETISNKQLDKVCRSKNAGEDITTAAHSFGEGDTKAEAEELLPTMNSIVKTMRKAGGWGNPYDQHLVFIVGKRYLMEGYMCHRQFIRKHWLARRKHDLKGKLAAAIFFRDYMGPIHIAFHLRHGDVAQKDMDYIDPQFETRTIPLSQGIQVLQGLLGPKSILHPVCDNVSISLYSEGKLSEFAAWSTYFPTTQFFLGNAETLGKDIEQMANADILIASPSSFTSLVAAINEDGIILVDKENPEKFEGINNSVKQTDVVKGNLDNFNAMFCKQKLHARHERNVLCGVKDEDIVDSSFELSDEYKEKRRRKIQHPLHVEIKKMRRKLALRDSDFSLEKLQSELYPDKLTLLSSFANDTHDATCFRREGISDEKEKYVTICSPNGPHPRGIIPKGDLRGSNHEVKPSVHLSYFLRTVANRIVSRGYQLPTFIVKGPNKKRAARMKQNMQVSGIQEEYIHWEDGFLASNITDDDKKNFMQGKNSYYACREIMGDKACRNGYTFSNMEMSVALKHIVIIREIADSARKYAKYEMAHKNHGHLERYSLVVEDDQFLPKDIRRQIVEVLLQTPEELGIVMLDDSFFFLGNYQPPEQILDYPFPMSYERNNTRTVGAYLISDSAALTLVDSGNFLPLYAPVDHQLRHALAKNQIMTNWVFPPMTCAGSQGIEVGITSSTGGGLRMDPGDRKGCRSCCERFYNTSISSMEEIFALGLRRKGE